jgi:hypothetical protein
MRSAYLVPSAIRTTGPNFLPILQNCDPYLRVRAKGRKRVRMSPGCWLRNGLELDHLRSGKCDAQHLGSEVHEHCRIAVFGADHGTEAVPIMADSVAHGVARHNSDGWLPVEGTSWEGPPGAGAARCHASSVRPLVCARPRCQSFFPPGRDPIRAQGFRAPKLSGERERQAKLADARRLADVEYVQAADALLEAADFAIDEKHGKTEVPLTTSKMTFALSTQLATRCHF